MAHGFSGVRDQRLDAYAERFAEAGLAALRVRLPPLRRQRRRAAPAAVDRAPARGLARRARPRARARRDRPEADRALGHARSAAATWWPTAARDPTSRRSCRRPRSPTASTALRATRRRGAAALTVAGLRDASSALLRPRAALHARGRPARHARGDDRARGRARLPRDRPAGQHVGEPRRRPGSMLTVGAYRPYRSSRKLRMPGARRRPATRTTPRPRRRAATGGRALAQRELDRATRSATSRSTWTRSSSARSPTRSSSSRGTCWPRRSRRLLGLPVLASPRDDLLEAAHAEDEDQRREADRRR